MCTYGPHYILWHDPGAEQEQIPHEKKTLADALENDVAECQVDLFFNILNNYFYMFNLHFQYSMKTW